MLCDIIKRTFLWEVLPDKAIRVFRLILSIAKMKTRDIVVESNKNKEPNSTTTKTSHFSSMSAVEKSKNHLQESFARESWIIKIRSSLIPWLNLIN